jgi:hypothetical protein
MSLFKKQCWNGRPIETGQSKDLSPPLGKRSIAVHTKIQNPGHLGIVDESIEPLAGARWRRAACGALGLLFFGVTAGLLPLAKAKNSPSSVPQVVLSAKTIYVENQTTDGQLQTAVYVELTKWGRYQIVENREKADLILSLSNGNIVRFVSGDAAAAPTAQIKAPPTAPPVADETVPPGFTRVSLLDPKTGSPLWSGQRKTSGPPASWHLLDGLREAIDKSRNTK